METSQPYHVLNNIKWADVLPHYPGSCLSPVFTTFAINYKNELWAWGDNSYGQLLSRKKAVLKPIKLFSDVKSIEYLGLSTYVLLNNGSLWKIYENKKILILNNVNEFIENELGNVEIGDFFSFYAITRNIWLGWKWFKKRMSGTV